MQSDFNYYIELITYFCISSCYLEDKLCFELNIFRFKYVYIFNVKGPYLIYLFAYLPSFGGGPTTENLEYTVSDILLNT